MQAFPQWDKLRGSLKSRHPRNGRKSAGKTEKQAFPQCGEDTTPLGINKKPPHGGYGGRRGTGLRLPGPVSLPPPRNSGAQEIKRKFNDLKE